MYLTLEMMGNAWEWSETSDKQKQEQNDVKQPTHCSGRQITQQKLLEMSKKNWPEMVKMKH